MANTLELAVTAEDSMEMETRSATRDAFRSLRSHDEQHQQQDLSTRAGRDKSANHSQSIPHSPPPQPSKPRKPFSFYMSVLMLALVALTVSWDSTTLAVATPTITSQLQGTTLQSFWASIAFMLGVVVTQPIYSSCVIFAVAGNMNVVIAGRALQGLGGGGLDVLQAVVLSDITTLKERPMYLGVMALAIAIGTVIGPLAGALFTEHVSWRWIGWINMPFAAIIVLLTIFFLHLRHVDLVWNAKLRLLDWVVFAFYEVRPAEPIIPHRIFANLTSAMALVSGFLNGMFMYSLILYIPLFFQAVFVRLWSRVDKDTSKATSYCFQVFLGAGIGTAFTTTTVQLQASVKLINDMGLAAGLLVFFRLFGALLGQTIGTTIFNSVFQHSLSGIGLLPDSLKILEEPNQAIGFIHSLGKLDLPDEVMAKLIDVYQSPFQVIWIVMAGISCLGVLASLLTKELTLERQDVGMQGFEGR
ncbi:hypothetical protein G7Z17_g2560 [Cylindrodendrum hubeiense]|uniref:Major facilitator superfamily (MFS) profile domain-containing protein n=1 Tax=Cylindrodendrum hubeiense TaxID=595255 RepID=A0A9P5HE36_9HYPO|nr:hypothetical protein G7Z17_g2560 [Cylindrodendrum hubeiense]